MLWRIVLSSLVCIGVLAFAQRPELKTSNGSLTVKLPAGGDFGIEYPSGFSSLTATFQAVASLTTENSVLRQTFSSLSTAFGSKDDQLSQATSSLSSTVDALSTSVAGGDTSLTTAISAAESSLSNYVSTLSSAISTTQTNNEAAQTSLDTRATDISNAVNTVSNGVSTVTSTASSIDTRLTELAGSTTGSDVSLTTAISSAEAGLSSFVSTLSTSLANSLSTTITTQAVLSSNVNSVSSAVADVSRDGASVSTTASVDTSNLKAADAQMSASLSTTASQQAQLSTTLTDTEAALTAAVNNVASLSSATATSLTTVSTAAQTLSASTSTSLSQLQSTVISNQAATSAELSSSTSSLEAQLADVDLLPPGEPFAEIAVESMGFCNGNTMRVWRNGELITFAPGTGLNVYVFRGENLTFFEGKTFNTFNDKANTNDESAAFVKYIGENTQRDDVIVIGAKDESVASASDPAFHKDVFSVMDTLGAKKYREAKLRMSYAIIAKRYTIPGGARVVEDIGLAQSDDEPGANPSTDCPWSEVPNYLSRPTKLLRRTFYRGARGTLLESVAPQYDLSLDALALAASTRMLQAAQVVEIRAQSGGICAGNTAKVWRNGVEIKWTYTGRGMNVAMFHRDTLELFYARFFDTHGNSAANSAGNGDAMAKVILDAAPGTVIAIVAKDQAVDTDFFGRNAERAIEMLGSHMIKELDQRESFAIIARRGGPDYGPVVEDHGKRYDGATSPDCSKDNNALKTAEIKLSFLKTA
eukprot:TRINITY_DN11733_c0_g2_i2.p1 TRINITY_DN11733_c0_g2~~TRINITY_DN11733_c0_g2_i2.p1  ORF type:complete len:759 (+),score=204.75 TRINITY_DN11733_c0_g2_i2:103-2379(+)